jgi:hypothetical protein
MDGANPIGLAGAVYFPDRDRSFQAVLPQVWSRDTHIGAAFD